MSDATAGSLCGTAGGSGSGGYGDVVPCGGDDAAAVAAAAASRSKQDRLKEKNRLAQRRFRARQKTMLEQMQVRMDDLAKQVRRHHMTRTWHAGLQRMYTLHVSSCAALS
jgi:hypothetical protein